MKKRILSLCLALIMVLALTPAVFAVKLPYSSDQDFYYKSQSDYVYHWIASTKTVEIKKIPSEADFNNSKYLEDGFKLLVEHITINYGVTTINAGAFRGMENLKTVEWVGDLDNEKIYTIGESAFEGCKSLTTVSIPGTRLDNVGANAFKNCESLTSVNFGDNPLTHLDSSAFTGCTSLDPDNIKGNAESVKNLVAAMKNDPEYYGLLPVTFDGHTLYLADDIVVLFGVKKIKTDFDFTNVTVKFTINNNTTVSATEYTEIGGKYFYACPINALELADTITAEFYDGVNLKARDTYKAMDYIDYVLEGNHAQDLAGEKADQLKKLACALQDYGHYLQLSGWTDGKSHNTIAASASNNDLSLVSGYVGGYAMAYDAADFPDGVKISLSLNSTTTLYVKAGSAVNSVNSIAPNDLDRGYDIDLGGKTVTASALSYVYAVLSSTDTETFTAAKKDAVAALYYYWAAAEAYAPNN